MARGAADEGVLQAVLHQFVDHHRQRRGRPAGQQQVVAVNGDGHRLVGPGQAGHRRLGDALQHGANVDQAKALLRQNLVHGGDAANAVDVGQQHLPRLQPVGVGQLQLHQHGHRLQVVLDAVVHLAHHGGAGDQAGVLDGQRRLIGQGGQQGLLAVAEGVACLLYTSDAADERSCVDLGGRRVI